MKTTALDERNCFAYLIDKGGSGKVLVLLLATLLTIFGAVIQFAIFMMAEGFQQSLGLSAGPIVFLAIMEITVFIAGTYACCLFSLLLKKRQPSIRSVAAERDVQAPAQPAPPAEIHRLQYKQLQHDQIYHRDIFVLSTHHKMGHFTLHLSKYASSMMEAGLTGDHETVKKKLVDSLIILMSCANTLNMSLETITTECEPEKLRLGWTGLTRSAAGFSPETTHGLICEFVVLKGHMCKAIEALDHIERFNSRETLEQSVTALWFVTLQALGASTNPEGAVDVEAAVRARLLPLEERFIYHDRVGTFDTDYVGWLQ
ncbi:hypothetical protein [Pseudomonas sp. Leaf58]|uniref:hypothetical protein n=2 Tax=Pseudomonas sp. Leaf58 TaxID=1736226 RepID=UPI0006F2CDAA|nr:hypothetical protein [Pseudomonas sp. Leaf58]KQN62218.1 hypothetical protein ASF02_08630 [Pseudomonas sp. Leaf58]